MYFVSIKILEENIYLILIPYDWELVKAMIDELQIIYKANTGMNVKININYSLEMPIEKVGGVIIKSKNHRLIVENTLVKRLLLLAQKTIPLLHCKLFGPNPTRIY